MPFVFGKDTVFAGIGLEKTAIDTQRFTTKKLQFFAQQNEITISSCLRYAVIFAKVGNGFIAGAKFFY